MWWQSISIVLALLRSAACYDAASPKKNVIEPQKCSDFYQMVPQHLKLICLVLAAGVPDFFPLVLPTFLRNVQ